LPDLDFDPLAKRAAADALVERVSSELRKLLQELAAALDPFPSFMGVGSLQAVEVRPDGVASADRGCIVVCPDGELRELVLRMVPGPIDIGGVEQIEEFEELSLPPGEYVAYACAAITTLARIIKERDWGLGWPPTP
jgi:hypothetical protein